MVKPDDWNLARDLFEHADSDNEFSGFDNPHRFPIETVQLLLGCHRDTLGELTMLYDDDCP